MNRPRSLTGEQWQSLHALKNKARGVFLCCAGEPVRSSIREIKLRLHQLQSEREDIHVNTSKVSSFFYPFFIVPYIWDTNRNFSTT